MTKIVLWSLIILVCNQVGDHAMRAESRETASFVIEVGDHSFDLNGLVEEEALAFLTGEELSILRNAIFAKYGYRFKTERFRKIFASYQWYAPEHDDVSAMLNACDLENIDLIRKYERGEMVYAVERVLEGKALKIRIEFYRRCGPFYAECAFTGFSIFEIAEGSKKKVYDLTQLGDEWCVYADSIETAVSIEDRNGDGDDECSFNFSDAIGPLYLVIRKIEGRYKAVYYGSTYDISYEDIDGDGSKELLSDHMGGGGFVSWWQGLTLASEFEDSMYVFSYRLTRIYHERGLREAEQAFSHTQTAETFARLLNAHADLGNHAECAALVNQNPELAHLETEAYGAYTAYSPIEDPIKFTIYRATEYERIWEELKTR